jgi:hypothetical protein
MYDFQDLSRFLCTTVFRRMPHFDIILSYTPKSPKCCLTFRFSDYNFVCISHLPNGYYVTTGIIVRRNVVKCRVIRAPKMTSSSSDDWIY